MLRYGIPDYRLPRTKLDAEIESILSLGIEVHTQIDVGTDITFNDLKRNYDCLYLSIGAHTDKKTGIEGENSRGVISAVELLRHIGDGEMPDFTGARVVVIGGGNVAMDVTRSAIRLGAQKVTCVYRRRQADMTAQMEEVEGAIAEGAEVLTLEAPVRIETDEGGNAVALWIQPQIIGEIDSNGRPRPNTARVEEVRLSADTIIVAIGQGIESASFEQSGIRIQRGGELLANSSTQMPEMEGVFAGGDCVTGPATVIRAIAAGKAAAANIDDYLGFHHGSGGGPDSARHRGGGDHRGFWRLRRGRHYLHRAGDGLSQALRRPLPALYPPAHRGRLRPVPGRNRESVQAGRHADDHRGLRHHRE